MQTVNEEVFDYLKKRFEKVRHVGDSIRINVFSLNRYDLQYLEESPYNNGILIKRSGKGLVVIFMTKKV